MNLVQSLYTNIKHKVTLPVMVVIAIGLLVYVPSWVWTIHTAYTQSGRTEVVLPILGSDSREYALLAVNLIDKHCFSLDACHTPETFRTIGYPLFIAVTAGLFHNLFFTTFIQILLMLITGYLLFQILNQFISYKLSVIGIVLFLLNPNVIQHTLLILSDTLFVFLIVLAFYVTLGKEFPRKFLWIGIILGVSVLVRPVSVFILPLYILAYHFFNKPNHSFLLRQIMLGVVGMSIVMFPWVLRNRIEMGAYGVSSVSNYNLIYYNVPMFVASKTGRSTEDIRNELINRSGISNSNLKNLSVSNTLLKTALQEIISRPVSYGIYHVSKTIPFFFGSSIKNIQLSYNLLYNDDIDRQFAESSISDALLSFKIKNTVQVLMKEGVVLLERLLLLLVMILACIGLWDKEKRKIVFVSLMFIAYFAILTGPVSYVRYRLPAEPFFLIAALAGVALLLERFASRTRS